MTMTQLALASALAFGSASAMAGGGPIDLSSGSAGFSNTPTAGAFTDIGKPDKPRGDMSSAS